MAGRFDLLLVEVYCDSIPPGGAGAYVRLQSSASEPISLSQFQLEWAGCLLRFPDDATLAPGASLYVAQDAECFRANLTRLPDYSLTPSTQVPQLITEHAEAPVLDLNRGTIRLLTADGTVADALCWGETDKVKGWTGPGLETVREGTVHRRAVVEESITGESAGRFVTPGGKAAAWRQGTEWIPRRLTMLGQSAFPYPSFTCPSGLAFAAPDCAYTAIRDFIDQTTTTLDINLYLLTNEALCDHLADAVKRGVRVRLLMEGEPYQGMPESNQRKIEQLREAGAQVRILRSSADGFKRFHLTHAKYAIADARFSLIMSDNWTFTSAPTYPRTGNRGWGVILESAELAAYLTNVLEFDWNPESPDSVALRKGIRLPVPAGGDWQEMAARPLPTPVGTLRVDEPFTATPVLAPDHALLESLGVIGLIRRAQRSLDVQQLNAQLYWGFDPTGSRKETPNLFLEELIAAARRGVRVRLLLGGRYLDPDDPRDNTQTRDYLLRLARREKLDLAVRVMDYDLTGMNIHNKGIIADQAEVLVSSINWTENSPLYNRELGVLLQSQALATYFGDLFERDWDGEVRENTYTRVVTRL